VPVTRSEARGPLSVHSLFHVESTQQRYAKSCRLLTAVPVSVVKSTLPAGLIGRPTRLHDPAFGAPYRVLCPFVSRVFFGFLPRGGPRLVLPSPPSEGGESWPLTGVPTFILVLGLLSFFVAMSRLPARPVTGVLPGRLPSLASGITLRPFFDGFLFFLNRIFDEIRYTAVPSRSLDASILHCVRDFFLVNVPFAQRCFLPETVFSFFSLCSWVFSLTLVNF